MLLGASDRGIRVGVVACAVVWSCALATGARADAADDACSVAGIPAARPTPVERANPRARPDYHQLVLTWAPVFFARHAAAREACAAGGAFVAAGLIPRSRAAAREEDQPRHCVPSMPLSRATVQRHFAVMPDPQFMQDSWVRYGGCAFANAWEYFDRLTDLHGRLRQPNLRRVARRGRTTAGAVRAAFVAANVALGLTPQHLVVASDPPGWLESVSACYDVRFRLIACPQPGLRDRTPLRLAERTARRPAGSGR